MDVVTGEGGKGYDEDVAREDRVGETEVEVVVEGGGDTGSGISSEGRGGAGGVDEESSTSLSSGIAATESVVKLGVDGSQAEVVGE